MTSLLEKLKDMSAEEVLGLNARGYRNQWEAGWQVLHPNKMLVGRAVTLQMMPARPDISGVDQADRRARNQTVFNHQTALYMLQGRRPGGGRLRDAVRRRDRRQPRVLHHEEDRH
jgi:hypothetical protein